MENATQLVHGTPRLAASHRTWEESKYGRIQCMNVGTIVPSAHDMSVRRLAGFVEDQTGHTHFASSRCALPGRRSAISSINSHFC